MKEKLTRKSSAGFTRRRVDWAEFDALTDEQIAAAVREDPDAAPIVDRGWFRAARAGSPQSNSNRRDDRPGLETQLVGAFGEKATEAELLRRGWRTANFNTSIKNAANYDLIAFKDGRTVHIRVKTCGAGQNAFQFSTKKGQELPTSNLLPTDYTVLVRIGVCRADDCFYVIPTRGLREQVNAWRRAALGSSRPPIDVGHWTLHLRALRTGEDRPNYGFARKWEPYKDNWELLDG